MGFVATKSEIGKLSHGCEGAGCSFPRGVACIKKGGVRACLVWCRKLRKRAKGRESGVAVAQEGDDSEQEVRGGKERKREVASESIAVTERCRRRAVTRE